MASKISKTVAIASLGLLAFATFHYIQSPSRDTLRPSPTRNSVTTAESGFSDRQDDRNPIIRPLADRESLERESFKRDMIKKLLSEYRDVISSVVAQVSLVDLRRFVIEMFPEDGRALFEDIIQSAFPDLADAILAAIALMDQYDQWMLDNMLTLNEMNTLEKNGHIWEKRTELFGEHAKQIWSDELSAVEERQQNMQKTIALLNSAYDTDINERLFMLKSAMEENYKGTMESMMFGQGMLSNVFFGFDSVQQDLHAMTPEARQEQISAVRRNLGFSEEQITEAAKADQEKEQRWQNGYQYMAEKAELSSSYSGEELDAELDKLREKYFKPDAETIRLEEQNGFERFKRPRLYGRN